METLRDIQIEYIALLKQKSFGELRELPAGFEIEDSRVKPPCSITVSIRLINDSKLEVRSTAIDNPESSPEEQLEEQKILGPEFPGEIVSMSWVDGFEIDSAGSIREMHPLIVED